MFYYIKKFWKINILTAIFLLVICALQVCSNLFLIQLFQSIIVWDMGRFIFWILVLGASFFIAHILDGIRNLLQSRAVRAMNNEVRKDMMVTLLQKNHQEFHMQASGEYLSRFTNDVLQIENLAWNPFFHCIELAAMAVFSAVALVTLHWSLLIAALVTTVIMLFSPNFFHGRLERLGKNCAEKQAIATGQLKDILAGYDVLSSFGRSGQLIQGVKQTSAQIEEPKLHLSVAKGFFSSGLGIINVVCQLLINALIGFLSLNGIIVQAALMGGGNLCGSLSGSLRQLASGFLAFSSAKPYFENCNVHDCKAQKLEAIGMKPLNDAIEMENVCFQYGERPVLQNLSLRFQKGKKYALIGPSGGGKSTLLKLLLGWLPDYDGTICFDGRNIKDFTPEQLQAQMSYIEQDVFLFNISIRDNITLGEKFSEAQMNKALRESALEGDLPSFENGLDTIVGENGCNLSGGQKQRVAIARALIHGRSILLVDEGTSALDQANADIVEKSLLANPDLTLLLISHHLSPQRKSQFDAVYQIG